MKTLLIALLLSPLLHAEADLLRWVPESKAIAVSKQSGKPILYDLTAAWCPPCKLQEKQVFNHPEHSAWINENLIPVRVVDRRREDRQNSLSTDALQKKYKLKAFPTLIVDMPAKSWLGNSKWKSTVGYNSPEATMHFLRLSVETLKNPSARQAPEIQEAQAPEPGTLTVRGWPKPPSDSIGYNIYMSPTSGRGYKKMTDAPITDLSYTVSGVEAGKNYYFMITLVDTKDGKPNESRPSAEFSFFSSPGKATTELPAAKSEAPKSFGKDLAADQDGAMRAIPAALVAMGDRFLKGRGVPKDVQEAKKFYINAAERNYSTAKSRLEEMDRLLHGWMEPTRRLPAVFSGFKRDGKNAWGTLWNSFQDDGSCGTRIFFPPTGSPPVENVAASGRPEEYAAHFSGHLGRQTNDCNTHPWATIASDFLPGSMPLSLAEHGVPNQGFRCLMRRGPKHPDGLQDYWITLHKFSISPNMLEYKGNDYTLSIPGHTISSESWTEIRVPFPKPGARPNQNLKSFSQPAWIPWSAVYPWDTEDLFMIDMGPSKRGQNFDFYVKEIGFF